MAIASPPLIDIRNVHLTLTSLAGPGRDPARHRFHRRAPARPSASSARPAPARRRLLMVIGGLERATGGQAIIDGHDLSRLNEDELTRFRRDRLGIVFQSFHLIPTMTALENVAIPLELKGAAQAFARAEEKLHAVGLGHRLVHYPGELSGGEQQRVAIARALAAGARIILADEPTGNLDQATGGQILDLLFDFNARERHHAAAGHPRSRHRPPLPPHRRVARRPDRAGGVMAWHLPLRIALRNLRSGARRLSHFPRLSHPRSSRDRQRRLALAGCRAGARRGGPAAARRRYRARAHSPADVR